jgi:hypothetical protein
VVGSSRYFGCAVGFGFGAVWMTVGLGSAILSLLCAALGYTVAFVAEHERASLGKLRPLSQKRLVDEESLLLEEFELDHYERRDGLPEEQRALGADEVEYGWPSPR